MSDYFAWRWWTYIQKCWTTPANGFHAFLQQGVRNIPSPDIDCETKINVSREYLENRTRSTVNVISAVITVCKIVTTEMNKKHCITLI